MADIKQTNFRIDQETADKFRKFCEENGLNQAQGFDYLVQLIAIDNAVAASPGQKTEIEAFKKLVKDITDAYVKSVTLCGETEARVRDQFQALLSSKDSTIKDLQDKAADLEDAKQQAVAQATAAAKAAAQAVKDADTAKKQADTAERLCDAKDETIAELREKLVGYEDLKLAHAELQDKAADLDHQASDLRQQLKDQQKDSEYALKTAVMEKEREYIEKISRLQAELELLKR